MKKLLDKTIKYCITLSNNEIKDLIQSFFYKNNIDLIVIDVSSNFGLVKIYVKESVKNTLKSECDKIIELIKDITTHNSPFIEVITPFDETKKLKDNSSAIIENDNSSILIEEAMIQEAENPIYVLDIYENMISSDLNIIFQEGNE